MNVLWVIDVRSYISDRVRLCLNICLLPYFIISHCSIPMIRICEIIIGNLKTRKSPNWFRYETFIHLFEFKGFSTWGERNTIFLCWLLLHLQLSTQPTRGILSAQSRLASLSSENQPSSSEAGTQLCFFSDPQILSQRFRCMTSFTPPGHISHLGFLFCHL